MDIVLRATLAFFFVLFLARIVGRRELASLQPFDLILLVMIGDLVQQGVTQNDFSVTGLVLDPDWLEDITLNTVEPSPVGEASRDGRIALELGRIPAGDEHRLYLHFQVNPTALGRRSQDVELYDGERLLLSVERDAIVWP